MKSPRWLKLKEACEYSALGRDTLKGLVDAGTIKGYQRGVRKDFIIDRLSIDKYHLAQIPDHKDNALAILKSLR